MQDYDRQDPKALPVAAIVLAILIFTLVCGGFVRAFYNQSVRTEYHNKVEAVPTVQWSKLKEDANKQLTSYGWVNQNAQIVHIPLDRAIELTVADLGKDAK